VEENPLKDIFNISFIVEEACKEKPLNQKYIKKIFLGSNANCLYQRTVVSKNFLGNTL
jgi:hypothetical protein